MVSNQVLGYSTQTDLQAGAIRSDRQSLSDLVWRSGDWFKRLEPPHHADQLVSRMKSLVELAASGLEAPILAQHLPELLHTRRCPDEIRLAVSGWSKHAYNFLSSEFPALSKRDLAALVKQAAALLVLESLQSTHNALGVVHPHLALLTSECKHLQQSKRRSTSAVLSVGALSLLGLGAGSRLHDVGILPNPLNYVTRSESEMLSQTATQLRKAGQEHKARLIENLDVTAIEQDILRSLGFSPQEIDLFERKDTLNHIGLIRSPLSAVNPHSEDEQLTLRAKYERLFDTVLVQPEHFDRADVVHELTHRLGYFAETGWDEQLKYSGPCLEIEEGICNLVARGPGSIDTYQNIFSAGVLAIMLGKEGALENQDDLTQAYHRGVRVLARGFIEDRSIQPIKDRYAVVTGASDAYFRDIELPFQNGLSGEAVPVTVLARLESLGVKADLVLGWFENEMAQQRGVAPFPALDRVNLVVRSNVGEKDVARSSDDQRSNARKSSLQKALGLIALRPGSTLATAYTCALAEELWNSGQPQARVQATQLLSIAVKDSSSIIRDRAVTMLALYGLRSGRLTPLQAEQLLQSVQSVTQPPSIPYYSTAMRDIRRAHTGEPGGLLSHVNAVE